MSFIEKITGTIYDPRNAIKKIADEPHIEEAVMIVGILAIIGVLAAYVQSYKIIMVFENMPPGMESFFTQGSMNTITMVSSLIGPFIMWIVGAGIIHFLSKAFGGEGVFYPRMMTIAGYSMIPQLIGNILSLALLLSIDPVTVTMDITDPNAENALLNIPFYSELKVIGWIFMLWGAAILVFGVQNVHKLSLKRSVIAVGIPFAIVLIPAIWGSIRSFVIS